MTTEIFCFYWQNRLIQTGQTGGQQYSDTFLFSIPWLDPKESLQPSLTFAGKASFITLHNKCHFYILFPLKTIVGQ
jgi:hypothetical protein